MIKIMKSRSKEAEAERRKIKCFLLKNDKALPFSLCQHRRHTNAYMCEGKMALKKKESNFKDYNPYSSHQLQKYLGARLHRDKITPLTSNEDGGEL